MSVYLFLYSIVAGALSRLIFLPANFITKKCNIVTSIICDAIFAFIALLPLVIGFHILSNGQIYFYAVIAFSCGLALTFLFKRRKNA